MNKQVYYWCTVIVIAVVVVIGWLTVSNNGNAGNINNNSSINNEMQQNVGYENEHEDEDGKAHSTAEDIIKAQSVEIQQMQ